VTRYLSLAEFWFLAEEVTGIPCRTLESMSRGDLADTALHAPRAGFGDQDLYPDPIEKAAVLACRLAWNHPLPDGNKRVAWACLIVFLDLNGYRWINGRPNVDQAVSAMSEVAAHRVDERWLSQWLRERVEHPG